MTDATPERQVCSVADIRGVACDREIAEIEAAQAALRESIEATKGLAQTAENLLKKHKKTLKAIRSD